METADIDKTGLIRESYRIEGISIEECRSIFLDWALKLPRELDEKAAISRLLETYGGKNPDHPMTAILREGLNEPMRKGRRGGRRARVLR